MAGGTYAGAWAGGAWEADGVRVLRGPVWWLNALVGRGEGRTFGATDESAVDEEMKVLLAHELRARGRGPHLSKRPGPRNQPMAECVGRASQSDSRLWPVLTCR